VNAKTEGYVQISKENKNLKEPNQENLERDRLRSGKGNS